MGQSRQSVWPATLLRTILQHRVPKVSGTTGEMNMGLSGNLIQFEPPNPMVIMVDYHCIIYIYT